MAANPSKTIIATGVSSGLGFEAVKQLLEQTTPVRIVLGARDVQAATAAFGSLPYDRSANSVKVLPLDLSNLHDVERFSQQVLKDDGVKNIDYLLLNAGISKDADEKPPHRYKWCDAVVVNHFSQHFLVHLLREKLAESKSRIVFVSSGAVRNVSDPRQLRNDLRAGSGIGFKKVYSGSKFAQLLSAHWWRRQLEESCRVIAVSPGLIPNTGLGRLSGLKLSMDMPDAKTASEGADSILAAFSRSDYPEDPEIIFLTSWGEWWPKDIYEFSLDKDLQNEWCPSKDDLENQMLTEC